MKVYVAGPFKRYEEVRALADAIVALGHELSHDWTRNSAFGPDGHLISASEADIPSKELAAHAQDDICGASTADLLVCIAHEPLCGALIEIGVALSVGTRVWLIAPWRESPFWDLPLVTVFDTKAAVLAALAS